MPFTGPKSSTHCPTCLEGSGNTMQSLTSSWSYVVNIKDPRNSYLDHLKFSFWCSGAKRFVKNGYVVLKPHLVGYLLKMDS